jgi:hypothetical protein
MLIDRPFVDDSDSQDIRYRLHPIDVGFDLRAQDCMIAIDPSDDPIRVSFPGIHGERRILEGAQAEVLRALEGLGFRFTIARDDQ